MDCKKVRWNQDEVKMGVGWASQILPITSIVQKVVHCFFLDQVTVISGPSSSPEHPAWSLEKGRAFPVSTTPKPRQIARLYMT
jgi:hypothetical protein